jgi:hypothetical protein
MGVGMGAYAVTWQELDAYANRSCPDLTIWEGDQIMMMSQLYCNYLNIGKKPSEPPYQREFTDEDIAAQNASIDKMLAEEEKAFTTLKA